MPSALSGRVSPSATEGLIGVMAMAFRVAAVTVKVALPVWGPEVTVMVVEPGATAVAVAPTIVATAGLEELHTAPTGRGPVDWSEKVARAVKLTVSAIVATGAPG